MEIKGRPGKRSSFKSRNAGRRILPRSCIRCFIRRNGRVNPCSSGKLETVLQAVPFFVPPILRPIDDLKEPLFGSDLSYEDVVDNFFAWDQQAISAPRRWTA